jgi:hypothetical protein
MKGAVQGGRFGSQSWGCANHGACCGMIKNDFSDGFDNTARPLHAHTISFCQEV